MAAAAIIGAGLVAYGQISSSQAQAAAMRKEAEQADFNARMASKKALSDSNTLVVQGRKVLGQQTADFASANLSGGTVDAVMAESAVNLELDRLSVLFGGDVRSTNFMRDSERANVGAGNTERAGYINAAGALFGAYGSRGANA